MGLTKVMITIKSFLPFRNMLRATHEFHDEKAIVKIKSITLEREYGFDYKDVMEISDAFHMDSDKASFGFWLLVFSAFILAAFSSRLHSIPLLLHIMQITFACGLFFYITSFKKSWRIFISDGKSNTLSYIVQNRKNQEFIPQIIEMIKDKSKGLIEISATNPFPEEQPEFEYTENNYSNIARITHKYYESEMIGFHKSPFEESIYRVSYNHLSGKIRRGKETVTVWGWPFTFAVLMISIVGAIYFGFDIKINASILKYSLYLVYVLVAIELVLLPISLIKREVVGFYDKNEKVAIWFLINKKNKENVEKIIEFVQLKTSSEIKE